MDSYQNYRRTIIDNIEESLSKIVNKVADNSVVLDVGCGAGMLGAYLTEKKGCTVDGVDSDTSAIEISRATYRKTAVKNLETETLTDVFSTGEYDLIVVADVIEHLVNPDFLLAELKKLLKTDGKIIFSVPNITHVAAGFELLLGKFLYRNNGLLDNTHVKFYSKTSLLAKLEAFGFYAWEVDSVKLEIDETEFSNNIAKVFPRHWLKNLISHREDALTYQWLVTVKTQPASTVGAKKTIEKQLAPLVYSSNLYWTDQNDTLLDEQSKLIGRQFAHNSENDIIDFHFSDAHALARIQQLRIDPVSDEKPFFIADAEIFSAKGEVIWKWNPEASKNEVHGARFLKQFGDDGCMFEASGNDPQWLPVIPAQILGQISAGCIFRLTLKIDESLFKFCNAALLKKLLTDNKTTSIKEAEIAILHSKIAELNGRIETVHNSNSWRLTRPLRELSLLRNRVMKLGFLYQKYSHLYPGVLGHAKLIYKCLRSMWTGGFSSLKNKVNYYENSHLQSSLNPQVYASEHKVLVLNEKTCSNVEAPASVAVHAHLFYPELASDLSFYLENIPVAFTLYITTDTEEKAAIIRKILADYKNADRIEMLITENRGRDIFPMLVTLGERLAKYDLVLHIHSKRSPHSSLDLAGWRRYLMESLLGTEHRISAIFEHFAKDRSLGILFPDYYHPIKPFIFRPQDESNDRSIRNLLLRAGKMKSEFSKIDRTFYPAGDMFWFRGKAIQPLVDMKLGSKDFEIENGQVNGTLAHAIERMFPYFALQAGLQTKSYLAASFQSQECSSHASDLFETYLKRGLILKPSVLFDHNGGGGTNIYTRELVAGRHNEGGSVLRVYCFNAVWYMQWIGRGDGMLFHTLSIDTLFKHLVSAGVTSIDVNSLYGYPDVGSAISKIIRLSKEMKIELDVRVHDFFALCPSPHLSDSEGKYCGVPKDLDVCGKCLKKNLGWYHLWYPKENRPTEINIWRKPFALLFEAASQVTFFDTSSVEILKKAFAIPDQKIRITPHKMDYLKNENSADLSGPVRIGVLGALSQIKGGDVVSDLYFHIENKGLNLPITIVGPSVVNTPKKVIVHGFYNQQELPAIIQRYGINVILMPSIVPETFSYTISEAIKLDLPIVAFDLGAQGNRVKEYNRGKVIPLGSKPDQILNAIQDVLKTARELNK